MSTSTLQYKTSLDIPWGKLQDIVEWCTTHCEHDWNFSVVEPGYQGKYTFSFENEKDYITFLLVTK